MSETLDRPVAFREIGIEEFRASLLRQGASPAIASGYADMMAAKADGFDNAIVRTHVNTSPTSFREWCKDVLKPAVEAPQDDPRTL